MSYEFIPDCNIASTIPPGETVREVMEFYNFTTEDFANRLGISEQDLKLILDGQQEITPSVADSLEMVTNTPSSFWIALETQHQEMIVAANDHLRQA